MDQLLNDKDLNEQAKFCSIVQPDPNLLDLLLIDLNISDKINQDNFLIIDTYIYMKLSNGSLISYEMIVNSDEASLKSIIFSQEIPFSFDSCLNTTMKSTVKNKLLFNNQTKQIVLVSCNKLYVISIIYLKQHQNKKSVMLLNKSLSLNGTIILSEIYENFLYIILNSSKIEIYDIRDFFQYSSIYLEEIVEFNSTPYIKDIAVNEDFLLVLENTTNSCFFLDRIGILLKNTLFLNGTVYDVEVFFDTVMVYYENIDGQLFLKEFVRLNKVSNYYQENNIFELKSMVKELEFVPRNLLITVHENLITFIRHSVKYPINITLYLKKTIAFEGVQLLHPITITENLNKNYTFLRDFILISNLRELHLMKISIDSAYLKCFPGDSIDTRKYTVNLALYYFNCSNDLEISCDYDEIRNDHIKVILNVYQELFESSNIALAIGLGIGFSLAFIITIIFCVYFYKIKHHYTTLVKEISPGETPKITKPMVYEDKSNYNDTIKKESTQN